MAPWTPIQIMLKNTFVPFGTNWYLNILPVSKYAVKLFQAGIKRAGSEIPTVMGTTLQVYIYEKLCNYTV